MDCMRDCAMKETRFISVYETVSLCFFIHFRSICLDNARESQIEADRTRQSRQSQTKPDRAGQSHKQPDRTGQNQTEPDRAGQSQTEPDRAGQRRTEPDRARHSRTEPDYSACSLFMMCMLACTRAQYFIPLRPSGHAAMVCPQQILPSMRMSMSQW